MVELFLLQVLKLHPKNEVDLLTQDIFIAPSRREPASNSLIEAIAVGLPVAFRNEGGHPEAVGIGGVPFTTDIELLEALREITARYTFYSSVVGEPLHRDIDSVAMQYIDVLRGTTPGGGCNSNQTDVSYQT